MIRLRRFVRIRESAGDGWKDDKLTRPRGRSRPLQSTRPRTHACSAAPRPCSASLDDKVDVTGHTIYGFLANSS